MCDQHGSPAWVTNMGHRHELSGRWEPRPECCRRTLFWSSLQTLSLPCFEKLSSKKYLCSIFILMPSFLFCSGLLTDFLIQYFFDWDFQGCSPLNATAACTVVAVICWWRVHNLLSSCAVSLGITPSHPGSVLGPDQGHL